MVAYSVCVFIYKFTILTAKGVELYLIFLPYLPSPPVSPFPPTITTWQHSPSLSSIEIETVFNSMKHVLL